MIQHSLSPSKIQNMKTITINQKKITVKQIIGEGQEAVVYKLSPTEVVKIYRQPNDP
jgi:predicted Ser/Thr protein kinase